MNRNLLEELKNRAKIMSVNELKNIKAERLMNMLQEDKATTKAFAQYLNAEGLLSYKYEFKCINCGQECTAYQRMLSKSVYCCDNCGQEISNDIIAQKSWIIYSIDKNELMSFQDDDVDFVEGTLKNIGDNIDNKNNVIEFNKKKEDKMEVCAGSSTEVKCKTNDLILDIEKRGKVEMKKIFISHSSKDKDICNAFVEVLEQLGVPETDILYTSSDRHGVPGDEDIFEYLKKHIEERINVFYMLSDNYYQSAYCLNEMGAAWIVQNEFSTFLLPNFSCQINGVINSNIKAYKLTSAIDLINFKNKITKMYSSNISETKWEDVKGKFLTVVTR